VRSLRLPCCAAWQHDLGLNAGAGVSGAGRACMQHACVVCKMWLHLEALCVHAVCIKAVWALITDDRTIYHAAACLVLHIGVSV
jgi:hypothetical protein